MRELSSMAVHIGVGVPARPSVNKAVHAELEARGLESMSLPLTFREYVLHAVDDMVDLCEHAGIPRKHQRTLREIEATVAAVRSNLIECAEALIPGGFLVVSFAGHGRRVADLDQDEGGQDGQDEGWLLADAYVSDDELAVWLDELPGRPICTVVADHCYGLGPFTTPRRGRSALRTPVALISAVDETQDLTMTPRSFASVLQATVFESPRCTSFGELAKRLGGEGRQQSPRVWCSLPELWLLQPFWFPDPAAQLPVPRVS